MDHLTSFSVHPIGVIRTPFHDRAQAPSQPRAELTHSSGEILLNAGHNFEQALEDLDGFEFIWILSWFHKNSNWKPKVLPPRGTTIKRGVFATRSPHRPNPIGLSLARLNEIKGRTIFVAETDLLDGTPILDLKPYLSFAEAFPTAETGWIAAPIVDDARFAVDWSELALAQVQWLRETCGIDLQAQAERVLSRDTEPHSYRRISRNASGVLQLAIKSWRLEFAVTTLRVSIMHVKSGYTLANLNARRSGEMLHDEAAHERFHKKWQLSPLVCK